MGRQFQKLLSDNDFHKWLRGKDEDVKDLLASAGALMQVVIQAGIVTEDDFNALTVHIKKEMFK